LPVTSFHSINPNHECIHDFAERKLDTDRQRPAGAIHRSPSTTPKPSTTNSMKNPNQIAALTALAAFIATLTLPGCAGPAVRHDVRVDRREDAAGRADARVTTRQDNRYDRRGDRRDRVETRAGY
jgi:hypothetical protein